MKKLIPALLLLPASCASVPGSLSSYKKIKAADSQGRSFTITEKGKILILEGGSAVQLVYKQKAKGGRAEYTEGLFAPNAAPQLTQPRFLEVKKNTLFIYDGQNTLLESLTLEK